eukprot:3357709-Rhodomonas_salina.2
MGWHTVWCMVAVTTETARKPSRNLKRQHHCLRLENIHRAYASWTQCGDSTWDSCMGRGWTF